MPFLIFYVLMKIWTLPRNVESFSILEKFWNSKLWNMAKNIILTISVFFPSYDWNVIFSLQILKCLSIVIAYLMVELSFKLYNGRILIIEFIFKQCSLKMVKKIIFKTFYKFLLLWLKRSFISKIFFRLLFVKV